VREQTLRKVERAWKEVFQPPERLTVDAWVEKYINLPSRFPGNYNGPFRIDRAPYSGEWYRAVGSKDVRKVSLVTTTQCGKTIFLSNAAAFAICCNAGPILFIFPNEDLASSFAEDRLDPIFDECKPVVAHRLPDPDKNKRLEKTFDSCTLRLVGSGSETSLISRPVKWLVMDEIDLYESGTDKKRAAIDLALERVKTFSWNHKILAASTPTTQHGNIWRFFLEGSQEHFYIPCFKCGHLQQLVFEQLKWGEHKDASGKWNLEAVAGDTWYQCIACPFKMNDLHKEMMLKDSRAKWIADNPASKVHRSFHLNGLYPLWTRFGQVASDFLKTKDHFDAYKNFYQNTLAKPWIDAVEDTRSSDEIAKHCGNYPEGFCPENPVACFLTADVQHDRIYYCVRAWCSGDTSYLLKAGQVPDLPALAGIAQLVWQCPSGAFKVSHGLVDSGDGAKTREIYEWCKLSRFIPTKGWGQSERRNDTHWYTKIDGVNLLTIKVDHFKDVLNHKIKLNVVTDDGQPVAGAWHLHAGVSADYLNQLTAEIPVETVDSFGQTKRKWKKVKPDNHFFDTEVMNIAAAFVMNLRYSNQSHCTIDAPAASKPNARQQDRPQYTMKRDDGRDFWEL
jgi:phage terminase large subunit GpA-like protein